MSSKFSAIPSIFVIYLLLVVSVEGHGISMSVEFEVKENESVEKEIHLEAVELDFLAPSSVFVVRSEASSPIKVFWFLEKDCQKSEVIIDAPIQLKSWSAMTRCAKNDKKILFEITAKEPSNGTLTLEEDPTVILLSEFSPTPSDGNRFQVADNHPFLKKVKLACLSDQVEIKLTSENVENSLEVYISFCSSNKGILYTTSYSPVLDIFLKSPKMEVFYDAYSCDSNITFYSNTTQPISPLIIRLESKYATNGTITVLVNGQIPSPESHVAEYETGTFTIENAQEEMVFELNYQSTMENIHAFFDVISGAISLHLSACKSRPDDVEFGEFQVGSHRIDINLEQLMSNTSCSLLEIHPSSVFFSVRPAHFSSATFSFWRPGSFATWHSALLLGLLIVLLAIALILIIHFGRRKTGQLIINGY